MPSQLELGMAPPNISNPIPLYQSTASPQLPYDTGLPLAAQHQPYSIGIATHTNNDSSPSAYLNSKETTPNPSFWIPGSHPNMEHSSNSSTSCPTIQSHQLDVPIAASQTQLAVQGIIQDYGDMHPFFESIDDRKSYIGSKDACESRYV